jgi:hypothetical protein
MEVEEQISKLLRQFDLEDIIDMMDLSEEEVLKILFNMGYELPEVI